MVYGGSTGSGGYGIPKGEIEILAESPINKKDLKKILALSSNEFSFFRKKREEHYGEETKDIPSKYLEQYLEKIRSLPIEYPLKDN